jgi:glutamine amidotransferase
LNWIKGETVRFDQSRLAINEKIPNMGWLDIHFANKQLLSDNLQDARFYFAHSYHVKVDKSENEWINAYYGYSFVAGVVSENIYGVQFHPEKSHKFGMQLLKNFTELT